MTTPQLRLEEIAAQEKQLVEEKAKLALLNGGTDIHTLSKQMGNSAAMIERHYSKLTATLAADKLA